MIILAVLASLGGYAFYRWYSTRLKFSCTADQKEIELWGIFDFKRDAEIQKSHKVRSLVTLKLSPAFLQRTFAQDKKSAWPQFMEAELGRPFREIEILLQLRDADVVKKLSSSRYELVSAAIYPSDGEEGEVYVRAFAAKPSKLPIIVRGTGIRCQLH